jgi:hypothetical protein
VHPNAWLSRIAHATSTPASRLEDPQLLEAAVAELWLSGAALDPELTHAASAPPTLAEPEVVFGGARWMRGLVSWAQLQAWGAAPEGAPPGVGSATPAMGIGFEDARALAHAQGGRLPTEAEWRAAVQGAAPGNHGLRWGGPSASGVFPAARSGILDGWGNAWEWTAEGVCVGGSFASPAHPGPRPHARLTGFRIVR